MPDIQVSSKLISLMTFLPLFFISITVHEFAHAYSAFKLGDDTAKKTGRMSLNPFKHIDLIGTVIVPLMTFASGFALIGWAKPVPVDNRNFKKRFRDDAIVSLAGPLANFILAVICFILFYLLVNRPENESFQILSNILWYGTYFNIFLFLFNLLPIPPLDGSHILFDIFPNKLTAKLMSLGLYGSFILLIFIYSPLWGLFMDLINFILALFLNVAGMR